MRPPCPNSLACHRREIQCGVCTHIFAEWKNRQGWDESVRSKLCEWAFISGKWPDLAPWWPPAVMDIHPSLSCFLSTSCSSIDLEVMIDAMSPPASSLRGILHSSSIGISSEPQHSLHLVMFGSDQSVSTPQLIPCCSSSSVLFFRDACSRWFYERKKAKKP